MLDQQLYEISSLNQLFQSSLPQEKRQFRFKPICNITQRQLILSLLYATQGLERYPFNQVNANFSITKRIVINHLTEGMIQTVLKQLLETVNMIAYLREKCKILSQNVNPQVKSFSFGIKNYLILSDTFYSQLLTQLQKQAGNIQIKKFEFQSTLSLIKFQGYVSDRTWLLNTLVKSVNNILTQSTKPIVTILNDFISLSQQYSNYQAKFIKQFYEVFLPVLKHQIILIKQWIMLKDPTDTCQFFIREPLKQEKVNQAQSFFHHSNPIYISALPDIFKPYVRQILHLGKTIRYIFLFYSEIQQYELMKYFDIQSQFKQILHLCSTSKQIQKIEEQKLLAKSRTKGMKKEKSTINNKLKQRKTKYFQQITIQKQNPCQMYLVTKNAFILGEIRKKTKLLQQKQLNLQPKSNQREEIKAFHIQVQSNIKRILRSLSEKCIKLFKIGEVVPIKDNDRIRKSIYNTLQGIRLFMLYGQGDFFQELIKLLYDTMDRPMNMISTNLVNNFIEEAKKSSNAQYVNNQILENVSFFYLKNPQRAIYLKGWHNFSILYKPSYPTNYIFTSKVMQNFGMIFNFIFQLKKCQYTVINIWQNYRKNPETNLSHMIIRNSIHNLLNGLITHVMTQIETEWKDFMEKFDQAKTIIQIIELTHRTIHNLKKITLEQKVLDQGIQSIMDLVDRFKKFNKISTNKLHYREQMDKFKDDLRMTATSLMRIDTYKEIIDFNDFYSSLE